MNEKDVKLGNLIKALSPPIIYMFITMSVEVVADIIIFVKQTKRIGNSADFLASYTFMENINNNFDKYSYLITFVSASIAVIVFGIMYFRGKTVYQIGGLKKTIANISVKDCGLIMSLGVLASLGLSRFVSILPLDNIIGNYEETSRNLLSGSIFIQIISLGVVVPIAEELIYRGLLFNGLIKIMDAKYALFATSVVFGIFHFNLLQGTYTFLLSLILICIYMRFKTIAAPIIIHASANIVAVISSNYGISEYINRNIWLYIAVMAMELAGGVALFNLIMKNDDENNDIKSSKLKYL